MTIELTCKRCGRPFSPQRRELINGPGFYRYCSEFCREAAQKRPEDPTSRLVGERALAAWRS
jgi:hypothetical protein